MKHKNKKASDFSATDYQPPLPPFFFFCGAFLRVAPEAAGFCCRGGTTLLAGAVDEPDADPGLGEVGGLLAVLLASLEKDEQPGIHQKSLHQQLQISLPHFPESEHVDFYFG